MDKQIIRKFFLIGIISLFAFVKAYSQTDTVATIGVVSACPGDTVLIPINVENFDNLGSIEFHILFDTAVLEFIDIINVHPNAYNTISNSTITQAHIASLSFTIPMNIGTAKYLDMVFYYKGGTSGVTFNFTPPDDPEVADFTTMLPLDSVKYFSGAITPASPPPPPTLITGPNLSCTGDTLTFTTNSVVGATSYNWLVPPGASILSGQGTTSIQVVFGASAGNVSVCAQNACGNSPYLDKFVDIGTYPAQPGAILGDTLVCGSSNHTYSIAPVSGATNYVWTIPPGALITAGQGTTSVNVQFSTAGGTISVYAENACGPSAVTSLTVNVNNVPTAPATINGPDTACVGDVYTFSVAPVTGATNYVWTVPFGAVIQSGQGTTSIDVIFGNVSGTVGVVAENVCGNSGTSSHLVIVYSYPVITASPSNQSVCELSPLSFTGAASGASSLQWKMNCGSGWVNVPPVPPYSGVNTPVLSISSASLAMNGCQYVLEAQNVCNIGSDTATLTVLTQPVITQQPQDTNICENGTAIFNVTATGASSYQWQINCGSGWSNVVNGGMYSGATSSMLVLTNVPTAFDGCQFRCELIAGCNVTSTIATLGVDGQVTFLVNPVNDTACSGSTASFSVTAVGTGFTYQWQQNCGTGWQNLINGGVYSGVNTSTLSLNLVPVSLNNCQYRCLAVNACNITSSSATLLVSESPNITAQPQPAQVCEGSAANFSVTVTGNVLSYQWQIRCGGGSWNAIPNGGIYSGSNTANLQISAVTTQMSGCEYRCVVYNGCTVNSNGASLDVHTAPLLLSQPQNQNACVGQTINFSVNASGNPVNYQWQINCGSGWQNMSNGSGISGVTTNALTISNVQLALDGCQVRVLLSNACPAVTSAAADINVSLGPNITLQPVNSTICENYPTSFTINVSGGNPSYQWEINCGSGWTSIPVGGIYSGMNTNTLYISNAGMSLSGCQYRCLVTDGCQTYSSIANLTVLQGPAILGQPLDAMVIAGSDTSFTVVAPTALSFQWYVNCGMGWAPVYNGINYTGASSPTLNIIGATLGMNGCEYRCVVSNICSDTSVAATLTVAPPPGQYQVYTGYVNACPGDTITVPIDVIDFDNIGSVQLKISYNSTSLTYLNTLNLNPGMAGATINVTGGNIYFNWTDTLPANIGSSKLFDIQFIYNGGISYLIHDLMYNQVTDFTLGPVAVNYFNGQVAPGSSPLIFGQPLSQSVCLGDTAYFSVTATGATSYQWQLNGTNIPGADSSALVVAGVTNSEVGLYTCIVTNGCGSTSSSQAALSIAPPPTIIMHPFSQNVCPGDSVNFIVSSIPNVGVFYQWHFNGVDIPGANNFMYTVNNAQPSNQGQYSCTVFNSCGAVTSNPGILTLLEPPTIVNQPLDVVDSIGANVTFSIFATGAGITYEWQENCGSGWITLSNTGMYSGVNTNTLTIAGIQQVMDSCQYRCNVYGYCSPAAISASAYLIISNPAIFIQDPADTSVCDGFNISFTAQATGYPAPTYSWEVNCGMGWQPVLNGGMFSGAFTSTLNLSAVNMAMDGCMFRCVATNLAGSVYSASAVLSVIQAPQISLQPHDTLVCDGSQASFMAASAVSANYQWQVSLNGGLTWGDLASIVPFSGANSPQLDIFPASLGMDGLIFRCEISNSCGLTYTIPSTLHVQALNQAGVNIYSDLSPNICEGEILTFFAVPFNGGTNPTFEWYLNGVQVASNQMTFTTGNLNTGDSIHVIMYTSVPCAVNNPVTSNAITIHVSPLPPADAGQDTNMICGSPLGVVLGGQPQAGLVYSWSPSTDLDDPFIPNPVATPNFTITYTLTVEDTVTGCINTDDVVIGLELPVAVITTPDTLVCAGSAVELTASGGDAYFWNTGDNTSSFIVFPQTSTNYSVTVSNAYGCTDSDQISIQVNPLPVMSIAYDPATGIATASPSGLQRYCYLLNGDTLYCGISDLFNVGTLVAYDTLEVIGMNLDGCEGSAVFGLGFDFIGYNAFTPNGDGINDVFMKGYELIILDRWGLELYRGADGWDGTFNGEKVTPGTYYYILTVKFRQKGVIVEQLRKGSVTVVATDN